MITLFRRLRQKFLESGSLTKYLLYAVGEIALVMIGILLALQVNNWNEQRKATEAERFLLTSLKEDFSIRLLELQEFKTARKNSIDAIHDIYYVINQPSSLSESKMDTLIGTMSNALTFNDQFKTLDMLFTTGMINQLTDEELKRRLILWPQQVEEMMEEQRARVIGYSDVLNPMLMKYIAVRSVYEKFSFRGYNLQKGLPVTYPSDYTGLISNPEFERYLAYLESYLIVNEIDSEIIMENTEEIITLLEHQLSEN